MNIGVSMWSFHKSAFERKINVEKFMRIVNELNLNYAELLNVFLEKGEENVVNKISKELNIKISAYDIDNDLVQTNLEKRKEEVNKIKEGVNVALKLEAPVVRVFGGELKEKITREEALRMIIEGLREGADYAKEHGILLALENHGEIYGTAKQLGYIISEVNSKALGINLDMGNFLLSGDNAVNAVRKIGKYVYHVHLKDFKEVKENAEFTSLDGKKYICVAPGEGETNFLEFLRGLKEVGYDGVLSIENEKKGDELINTTNAIRNVKEYLRRI